MSKSTDIKTLKKTAPENMNRSRKAWDVILSSVPPVDKFDYKKDELATELTALMVFSQKNRSCLAEELGWKRSRISKVLSGNGNSTIKTIWGFCDVLGYEFDVVFRNKNERKPRQPWQKVQTSHLLNHGFPQYSVLVKVQDRQSVAMDLESGHGASFYISISGPNTGRVTSSDVDQVKIDVPRFTIPLQLSNSMKLNSTVLNAHP